jgi:4-hydroxy-tetrahydrodipicolinate synthase
MVTPFDAGFGLDLPKAKRLAHMLVDTGTEAIVVGGTTGESPALSHEEKICLFRAVIEAVGQDVPVIAGTGTNSTRDSIALTKEAEEAGADGIMLVTPYYNKPPQQGLVDHFTKVAQATGLPVLLYNVPSRTGVNLLPASLERLAAAPNIVAVKEASGNIDQVTEILRRVPDDFIVYSGDDSFTLPLLSVGGYGIVSVASHVAGPLIAEMLKHYVLGDTAAAAKAHRDLFPLFKALFVTTNPIPVKAALSMAGFDVGGLRLPLSPMSPEDQKVLRQAMAEVGILKCP